MTKHILKDFFASQTALDEFICSMGYNQVARISNGVLRVFRCDFVTQDGKAQGGRLIKNIFPANFQERLDAETPAKKKYHHH